MSAVIAKAGGASSSSQPTPVMTKASMKRLAKDIADIIRSPMTSDGIYYHHDDSNLLKAVAMIVGPSDTPYHGGYYFFDFKFSVDYPFSPPAVLFSTCGQNFRFNPNLYACGKVCVSLLNTWKGEQWSSCMSIRQVLLQLVLLFTKEPLLNEPGMCKDYSGIPIYTQLVEYKNIEIAIVKMLRECRQPASEVLVEVVPFSGFDRFRVFLGVMEEHFRANFETLRALLLERIATFPMPITVKLSTYILKYTLSYEALLNILTTAYEVQDLGTCKQGGGGGGGDGGGDGEEADVAGEEATGKECVVVP